MKESRPMPIGGHIMCKTSKQLKTLAVLAVAISASVVHGQKNADPLPPQLTREQREHLLSFLQKHEKPDRFIPRDAKVIGTQGAGADLKDNAAPAAPVKQYTVQITPHRPVPG